jgi:hypothetical protein
MFKSIKISIFAVTLFFMTMGGSLGSDCAAGGVGAESCTFRSQVTILGVGLWAVKGPSVSCGEGFYACCNATSANCVENPSIAP